MIGIAFGYPSAEELRLWELPDELRFARIEVGDSFVSNTGRTVGPYYWRKWELPQEEKNTLAEKILSELSDIPHRPREISGFTLFYQNSVYTKSDGTKTDGPGFQMSVRRKGEDGWDMKIIPEAEAMKVFRLLENSGHPDGPWVLTDNMRVDVRDSFIIPQSAVEGWPAKKPYEEPEYFDGEGEGLARTDKWPYARARREGDDLLTLVEAAGRAVEGRTAVQATILPDDA
jgi:hypothetical protein